MKVGQSLEPPVKPKTALKKDASSSSSSSKGSWYSKSIQLLFDRWSHTANFVSKSRWKPSNTQAVVAAQVLNSCWSSNGMRESPETRYVWHSEALAMNQRYCFIKKRIHFVGSWKEKLSKNPPKKWLDFGAKAQSPPMPWASSAPHVFRLEPDPAETRSAFVCWGGVTLQRWIGSMYVFFGSCLLETFGFVGWRLVSWLLVSRCF